MPRRLFPLLVVLLILAAAVLAWIWWSDTLLIGQCDDAGGNWSAAERICDVTRSPASSASPGR